jgi:HSP20 family protein
MQWKRSGHNSHIDHRPLHRIGRMIVMARRNPDDWLWQVGTELQRMSEEMFRSGATLIRRNFWEPRVDLAEGETHLVLKAEIAGMRGDDIQLLYNPDEHAIVIRGTRVEEDLPEMCRVGCFQLEVYYGEFEREVRLPDVEIDPTGMKARYSNGFLVVFIPKLAPVPSES